MSVKLVRLQHNFSRAAREYDQRSRFQQVETRRVYDAALMLLRDGAKVVDIGCGTGFFAELAQERPWAIHGVDIAEGMCREASKRGFVAQADAQALPFADGSMDVAVSSLCLQWVGDIGAAMREMARVVKPGGRAIIATLGPDSLQELRAAANAAELPLGLLPMRGADAYLAAAHDAGFDVTMADHTKAVEYYPSVKALLDSMRMIGAGNNFAAAPRGLTGVARWKSMLAEYQRLQGPHGLPATWERLFMILRKPA